METYYAVLDIKKYHSLSSLRMQERHNDREYPMNHIDDNLTGFNRELVPWAGLPHYTDRWKEIVIRKEAEIGHKVSMRKNSVIALDIVTAFTPGAEKALDIDIDAWCEANLQFMKDTFGEDNILAMTLHCDEIDTVDDLGRRGIHIHTEVVPIDDRDRMCAKSFVGSRMKLKMMHDSYASYMKPFGLSRGENGSKMKHEDRRRWYTNVTKLCRLEAPRIKDGETMEQFLSRLDKEFQDLNLRLSAALEKADKKIAVSETRQRQIFSEYAYAVNLQHILEEEYGGDMRLVKQRLLEYQKLEKSVPRVSLQEIIADVLRRNPPDLSIAMLRTGKKKKHAKWESLDDTQITQANASSGSESADFFDKKEKVEDELLGLQDDFKNKESAIPDAAFNKDDKQEESFENKGRSQSLLTEEGRAAYMERRNKSGKEEPESLREESSHGETDPLANRFGEKLEN